MGYSAITSKEDRTFLRLAFHPNFSLPPSPIHQDGLEAFVLESAARFVSPPKIVDEDETFKSKDLAFAIERRLGSLLQHRVRHITKANPTIRRILKRVQSLIYSYDDREYIACEDLATAIRSITV